VQTVERTLEAGVYNRERIISTAMTLLNAGHETTAGMIGLGTQVLLQNPEELAKLKADPAGRTPAVVEELLRYLNTADLVTVRTATADIEIGGVTIREGEGALALGGSANHDPSQYPNPQVFDPDRDTAQHVAFGFGIHQCLGQNLARLELEIVFRSLFSRLPQLRLAVDEPVSLPYKGDAVLYGVRSVPVAW
jgi:cytochrome P450